LDFEQQLKPVYQDSVRFSRALAGSISSGDDLLQDSLIKAWRGYDKLKDESKFKSWLLKIISNTHRTNMRKNWLKRIVSLEAVAEAPYPEGLNFEEKEAVRTALQKVPQAQRESLILFEILGMSIAEIANLQNISESAIKSRLSRGRVKLKTAYQNLDNPETYNEANVVQIS